MYFTYWITNERMDKTYIGCTKSLKTRIKQHRNGEVQTTKNFGKFKPYLLEKIETYNEAYKREKYWKSSPVRKKLKKLFKNYILPPSSSG